MKVVNKFEGPDFVEHLNAPAQIGETSLAPIPANSASVSKKVARKAARRAQGILSDRKWWRALNGWEGQRT
jgi:hypothetical protein